MPGTVGCVYNVVAMVMVMVGYGNGNIGYMYSTCIYLLRCLSYCRNVSSLQLIEGVCCWLKHVIEMSTLN